MIYVHWIIILIYAIIVIASMIAVLMDNRQPAKAMAWLMVLAFIPVVGVIIYVFFGQNIRKERIIGRHSLKELKRRDMLKFLKNEETEDIVNHKQLIKLFSHQGWAQPFNNNEVEIYTKGSDFFPILMKSFRKAKHHIHLLSYIFADDELGQQIADILKEKAREGVVVRVIYDDVGCWRVSSRFYKQMASAGVDVRPFMPVHFPMLTSKVNYRNHRKLCVVDGHEAFIGGMNIAQRYITGTGKQTWRDTHLMIRGGAVYGIQEAFLADWFFVSQDLITDKIYYPAIDDNIKNKCLAQVVTSSPTSTYPDIMQGYVRIILEAKKYVYIETPYFLPTEPVLLALRTAALSGVDIRLMIPRHSDAKLAEWASRSYVMQVLDAGVKVYFYKAGFNHSKLLISDDTLCTCGSTNVDFRSFDNNFESNVFFYDNEMALRMKKVFMEDQRRCILINDVKIISNRPFFYRFWESVVRLFAPLL